MTDANVVVPREIGRANLFDLKVTWQDAHESVYPARLLRFSCSCAGCVDEMTGERRLVASMVPRDVKPLGIRLVGRYAITIEWSDGHRTGIYPFDLLRRLCSCDTCRDR